jgi:hypothetical protein
MLFSSSIILPDNILASPGFLLILRNHHHLSIRPFRRPGVSSRHAAFL